MRWRHGGLVYCGIHGSKVEKRLVCYWAVFIRSDHIPHIQLYPNLDFFFFFNSQSVKPNPYLKVKMAHYHDLAKYLVIYYYFETRVQETQVLHVTQVSKTRVTKKCNTMAHANLTFF